MERTPTDRALDLIRHFGMPTSFRIYDADSYLWNGQNLALYYRRDNQILPIDAKTIIHELCHWLLADEYQKSFPEYGFRGLFWYDTPKNLKSNLNELLKLHEMLIIFLEYQFYLDCDMFSFIPNLKSFDLDLVKKEISKLNIYLPDLMEILE